MLIDLRDDDSPFKLFGWRAILNGEDVTKQCFMIDTDRSIVGVYLRNADGEFYHNCYGTFALEYRIGKVQLILPGIA